VLQWSTTATDNGFVSPEAYSSGDIACHRGAENAKGSAVVAAGGEIFLQWDTWPTSHKGPVIDYLAPCGEDCSTVDKASLEFFKIQEVGIVSGSGNNGVWASDQLIENGNGWVVKVPETLAAGNYVLRHEIIAHHASGQANGAQNYPQCINIQVTGGGSDLPSGTVATSLYKADDEGILFDIYSAGSTYPMPGPAAPEIASVAVQRRVTADSEGTPVTGGGSAPAPAPPSTTAPTTPPAASSPVAAPPSSTAPVTPPAASSPAAPVDEEVEEPTTPPTTPPTVPDECPTAARRRARRAARNARRHARSVRL
jgi:AA9 family protein